MKKIILMISIVLMTLISANTKANVWSFFNYRWSIVFDREGCEFGYGICISLAKAPDVNGGEFTINKETMVCSLTIDAKTKGIDEYFNNEYFNLEKDNPINPAVTKAELGIDGNFYIPKGKYSYTKKDGFYAVSFKLNKIK